MGRAVSYTAESVWKRQRADVEAADRELRSIRCVYQGVKVGRKVIWFSL